MTAPQATAKRYAGENLTTSRRRWPRSCRARSCGRSRRASCTAKARLPE
ncbi:MAG: hypothetical protein ACLTDR_12590 [Adlercreutzia equolifaciens]